MFFKDEVDINPHLAFLNTHIVSYIINVYCPGIGVESGYLRKIPIAKNMNCISENDISDAISLSKQDWDAHETSWDFQCNELLSVDEQTYMDNINNFIEDHYKDWRAHLHRPFRTRVGQLGVAHGAIQAEVGA